MYTQSHFALKKDFLELCTCHCEFHSNVVNYMQNRKCSRTCRRVRYVSCIPVIMIFSRKSHNRFQTPQMMVLSEFWAHKMHQIIGNPSQIHLVFYRISHSHPCKKSPQGEKVFRWWWCKLFSRIVNSIIKLDYFNHFHQIIYLISANCCAHKYES